VAQVPFFTDQMHQKLDSNFRTPVLIRIEPERLKNIIGPDVNIPNNIEGLIKSGLRGSMKTGNLLTGSLFIDLEFYPKEKLEKEPAEISDYAVIPTISVGLAQIQQKLLETLDKVNNLPLNPMIQQATKTLNESQQTMKHLQQTLENLNKLTPSQSMQQLPADMQKTLKELNRSMQGFQPGSAAYNKMVTDMQRLDQVLRELQPVLRTLNDKSNALVFEAKDNPDPQPKRAK